MKTTSLETLEVVYRKFLSLGGWKSDLYTRTEYVDAWDAAYDECVKNGENFDEFMSIFMNNN